ncbi:monosaccharide ABC transporter membrane protein, CUT2 family [Rhizobiales bacterium GAS191]|nr:monosaccharide ABC transporter membrane protein, CUT2 family [Rhizobiales bacterium GAS191]
MTGADAANSHANGVIRSKRRSKIRSMTRQARAFGMPLLFAASILWTAVVHPDFGAFDVQSLALAALPLAMATAAQAIVVISGGIDLSIGSLIAVSNVLSASLMQHASFQQSLLLTLFVIAVGAVQGAINGLIVAASRIPDVVVTLTTGFIWGGVALLILERPGGGAPAEFLNVGAGADLSPWLPNALILLVVAIGGIWLPIRLSRVGLLLYATGSDPVAAFRSGVDTRLARTLAYVFGGIACAVGGIALTMTTGIGAPLAGAYYTLSSVAAVVIGGVSLNGGRGGMVGPVIAALLLTLIPMDLIFLNIDPNYGQVIQGGLIVLVVMVGGFAAFLQGRK